MGVSIKLVSGSQSDSGYSSRPVLTWFWDRLGSRQPSSPTKFSYGLALVGMGFLLLTYASLLTNLGPVSPLWLIGVYLLLTIGELRLGPIGFSTVSRLAPTRMLGLMMGIWFLSISLGNYVAG